MFGKNSSCCVVCYINALYFTLSHKCPVCGCPFWPTSFRCLIYEFWKIWRIWNFTRFCKITWELWRKLLRFKAVSRKIVTRIKWPLKAVTSWPKSELKRFKGYVFLFSIINIARIFRKNDYINITSRKIRVTDSQ